MFPLNVVSVPPQLTREEPDQLAHVTAIDRVIYIQLMVSCLLRGIIWQSDKQTDRQTDKQSVGYWQRSHCQSHCHSVPLSSPTATGQYLSRQSPSLPNIEQHAVAVSFPSDFWTRCLCFLLPLLLVVQYWQDMHGLMESLPVTSFSLSSLFLALCLFFNLLLEKFFLTYCLKKVLKKLYYLPVYFLNFFLFCCHKMYFTNKNHGSRGFH